MTKLTAKAVINAKPKEKAYRLGDGGGLFLHVRKSGAKAWESRYIKPSTSKPTYVGLGGYPDVSLADARLKAANVRKLVSEGIDPKQQKDLEKAKLVEEHSNTFHAVATLWMESKRNRIKPKTIEGNWRKLELYAFPALKTMPILICLWQKLERYTLSVSKLVELPAKRT